jgi:hypothetical protein
LHWPTAAVIIAAIISGAISGTIISLGYFEMKAKQKF